MINNNLVMLDKCDNYIIDHFFDRKEVKQKNDKNVKFVKIGTTQNLSSYILIKLNVETIELSKSRKKSKSYYCEVIFTGLRQPTKKITIDTYTILYKFINRFKVSDIDICIDGLSDIPINDKNIDRYYYIFRDYINSFSDALIERTSFYINVPTNPSKDTDYFKKILLYDKYIKESRNKKVEDKYINWKRLEVTLNVKCKFKGFNLDDYLGDIQSIGKKYFNSSSFTYEYLELQKKLLTDSRTHRGNNAL